MEQANWWLPLQSLQSLPGRLACASAGSQPRLLRPQAQLAQPQPAAAERLFWGYALGTNVAQKEIFIVFPSPLWRIQSIPSSCRRDATCCSAWELLGAARNRSERRGSGWKDVSWQMLGPCVPSASAKQTKARKNNSFRRPARRQDSASVLWWQLSASPQRRWKATSCLNIIFCRRMPALSPAAGRDAAPSPSAPAVPARLEAPEAAPGALGGCPAPRAPLLPVLLWLGGWEGKEWRDAAVASPGLCKKRRNLGGHGKKCRVGVCSGD